MIKNINLIVIFFSFFIIYSNFILAKDYELLDRIIATAEKDVVTEKEVLNEISKNYIYQEIPKNELQKIKKETLKFLIEKKIILQYAENLNIMPSEQEIGIVLKNIAQKNGMTVEEFEKQFESEKEKIVAFKKDLKFQLTIQKIKDREIMPFVNVSNYEIDAWLNKKKTESNKEYKISHILLKEINAEKEEIIKKILNPINTEKFSSYAKIYSEGPNAEIGGDLGWNKINDLPEIFVEFISNAKTGQISNPIKSSNGIHILKVESIKNDLNVETVMVRQLQFQQILLKANAISSDEDLKKKLENYKNLVDDGLEFYEAVKLYSDDQFNIDPKKLEWVNFNNLLPEFRNNISVVNNKNIYGPFKTELGWHLVKVYDFREIDLSNDLEKQTAKIEIARNKTDLRFQDWLEALINNSKIKYFEDN
jgi:peptidyl-prolyl cis-trans isomerase SurA